MLLKNKSLNHHSIELSPEIIQRSQRVLPVAGYFILLFAGIDYLSFLVPFHLFDPSWTLQTIGKCVDSIWSLLLGLVMVFANRQQVKLGELKILAWLSRLVLVVAILYFVIFPLAITGSVRIHRQNVATLNSQLSQQSTQYQQQKELLNNATTGELARSIARRNAQLSQSDKSVESPQELKQRLNSELENNFQQSQSQAKESFERKKWSLVKTGVKWSVGSVISGVMLIWIWVLTDWTRKVTLGLQEEE